MMLACLHVLELVSFLYRLQLLQQRSTNSKAFPCSTWKQGVYIIEVILKISKSNAGKIGENKMIVKSAFDISQHPRSKSLFRTPSLSPLVTCLT